jgi:hypothetical protein
MNKREFKSLVDRIIVEWIESVDKDGDGLISRKEFYDNLNSVYGWQGPVVGFFNRVNLISFDCSMACKKEHQQNI